MDSRKLQDTDHLPTVRSGKELDEAARASELQWFMSHLPLKWDGEQIIAQVPAFGNPDKGLRESQIRSFDYFITNYTNCRPILEQALFDAYLQERAEILGLDLEDDKAGELPEDFDDLGLGEMLPHATNPGEMLSFLHGPEILFLDEERDGFAYGVLQFEPEWSVNAFGILFHGDRILYKGTHPSEQDISYIESIAEDA